MLRDVHIVLDTNKTYPKRCDYLFSFNLNLDLLTLALEILYFNTHDLEKVQGKSLACIKSSGGPLSALTCCVNVRLLSAIKKISPLIYSQSWVGSWVYTTQAMMTFTLIF